MENRYIINYDIKQKCITNNIRYKQGDVDSSVLEIRLIDNGVAIPITGETIEFRFEKPDKTVVYQDSTTGVTIIDDINGVVECVLKSNTLAAAGLEKCEIYRSKDGKELTTPSFNFNVEASIGVDGVKSTNYIKLIDDKVTGWQAQIDGMQTEYNNLKTIIIDENQAANLQDQINQQTSQLNEKLNQSDFLNPINQSNVLVLSESILGQGQCVPQFQSQFTPQPSVLQSIFGGSHISAALAEMADEIYLPSIEENALVNSNDLTVVAGVSSPGWLASGTTCTYTKANLPDGTAWTKIVKNDTTAYKGFAYDYLSYPTGAKGIFVSFELYIPLTSDPSPLTAIWVVLDNMTTSLGEIFYQFNGLVPGKKYKLSCWFPASSIIWTAGAGDRIKLSFHANRNASPVSNAPCTCYVRNVGLSFFSNGYQRYVGTGSSAASAQAISMQTVNKNKYNYQNIDTAIISYGRNEANDGVDAYSHYRAYDKLISQCIKKCQTVVPGNPPPHNDTANGTYDLTDLYNYYGDQRFDLYWLKIMAKWNIGINVWQKFKDLVSAGTYNANQIQADSWHPNNTGGLIIAQMYANEIKARKIINNCQPELKNTVKYYILGIPTGSWTVSNPIDGVESRILAGLNLCYVSSTLNDYLLFTNITAEQLHIIFRQDSTYGTFDVIVDEGTPKQRTFSINAGQQAERVHGQFICDFLDSEVHTVKIKVTSSGLPVKIHGIVAI